MSKSNKLIKLQSKNKGLLLWLGLLIPGVAVGSSLPLLLKDNDLEEKSILLKSKVLNNLLEDTKLVLNFDEQNIKFLSLKELNLIFADEQDNEYSFNEMVDENGSITFEAEKLIEGKNYILKKVSSSRFNFTFDSIDLSNRIINKTSKVDENGDLIFYRQFDSSKKGQTIAIEIETNKNKNVTRLVTIDDTGMAQIKPIQLEEFKNFDLSDTKFKANWKIKTKNDFLKYDSKFYFGKIVIFYDKKLKNNLTYFKLPKNEVWNINDKISINYFNYLKNANETKIFSINEDGTLKIDQLDKLNGNIEVNYDNIKLLKGESKFSQLFAVPYNRNSNNHDSFIASDPILDYNNLIKKIFPKYKFNYSLNNKQVLNLKLNNENNLVFKLLKDKKIILKYKSQSFNEKIYFAKNLIKDVSAQARNKFIDINDIELVNGTIQKNRLYELESIYFVDSFLQVNENNLTKERAINYDPKFLKRVFKDLSDEAFFTSEKKLGKFDAEMIVLDSPKLYEAKLKFIIHDQDNLLIDENYEVELDVTLRTLTANNKTKKIVAKTSIENNKKVVEFVVNEVLLNKENLVNKITIKNIKQNNKIQDKEISINQIFSNKVWLKNKVGGYTPVLTNIELNEANPVKAKYLLDIELSDNLKHFKNQLKFIGQISQTKISDNRNPQLLKINSNEFAKLKNNNVAIVFDNLVSNRKYRNFDLFVDVNENVSTNNKNSIIQSNSAFSVLVNEFATPAKLTSVELVEEINTLDKLKLKYKISSLDEILVDKDILNLTLTPTNNKRRYFFEQNKQLVKEGNEYFVTFEFDVVSGTDFRKYIKDDANILATKIEENKVEEGLDYNLVLKFNSRPSRANENIKVANIPDNNFSFLINNLTKSPGNSIQTLGKKFTFKENLEYQNNKTEWNANEDVKVDLIIDQKEIPNRLYKEKIRLVFSYKTVDGHIQTVTTDEIALEDGTNDTLNQRRINFTIKANELKANRLYTFAKVEKYNSSTQIWEKLDDDKENNPTIVKGDFKVKPSITEAFKVNSAKFIKDKTNITRAFANLWIEDIDNVLSVKDDLNLTIKYIIEGDDVEKVGSNPHLVIDDNNLKQIIFEVNDFNINKTYKIKTVKYVSSIDKNKNTLTIGAYPEKDELIFTIANKEIKIENANVEIFETTNLHATKNEKEITASYNLKSNYITLFDNEEINNFNVIAHFKDLKNQNIYTDVIAIDSNNNFSFSLNESKNIQFNHKYTLKNIYAGTKEQLNKAIIDNNFDSLAKLNIDHLTKEVITESNPTSVSIENVFVNLDENNKAKLILNLNSKDGYFNTNQQVKVSIKQSTNKNIVKEHVFNLSEVSDDKTNAKIEAEFNNLKEETIYQINKIIFNNEINDLAKQPILVHENYQDIDPNLDYFFEFTTKQNQFKINKITFVNDQNIAKDNSKYLSSENVYFNLNYEKSVERFNNKKVKLIFKFNDLDNDGDLIEREIETISSNAITSNNQTLNFEISNSKLTKNREFTFKKALYESTNGIWSDFDTNTNLTILHNKKFQISPSQSLWFIKPEFVKNESNIDKLIVKITVNDLDNVLGKNTNTKFKYKDLLAPNVFVNADNLKFIKENNQKIFKFEILNPILDHEYKIANYEIDYVNEVAFSKYLSDETLPNKIEDITINQEVDKQLSIVETTQLSSHASEPIISATYNINSNIAFLYTNDKTTKAHFVVHFTNEQNEDIYSDVIEIDENNNLNIFLDHSKNITLANTYTLQNIYLAKKEILDNSIKSKNFNNLLKINIENLNKQVSTKLFNLDEIFKSITPEFKQNFELRNKQKITLSLVNDINKIPQLWQNKKVVLEYRSKNFDEKIYFAKDLSSNDFIVQNNQIEINDIELIDGIIKKSRLYSLQNIYFMEQNLEINNTNLSQEISIKNNTKFINDTFSNVIDQASFTTEKSQNNLDATMQILDSPSLNQVKLKFTIIDKDNILINNNYQVELNTTLKTLTANNKNKKFIGVTTIENNQKVVEFVVDDVFLNKENIADNLIIKNLTTTEGIENKKIIINQFFTNKIAIKLKSGGYNPELINTDQINNNSINSTYNLEIEISENLNNIKNNLRFIGQIIQSQVSDNRNTQALIINSGSSVQLNDNNVTIVFDNLVSNRKYRNFDLFVDVNENVSTNNKNSIIQSNSAFSVLVNEFATPAKLTSVELVEEINTLDKLKLKYKISSLDEILVDKDILNLTLTPTNNKRRYFFEQNKQLVKEGNEYFVTFEFDVVSGTDFRKYIKDDVNISATKIEDNKVEEGLDYNLVLKFNSRPSRANENIKVANISDNNFSFLINNLTKSPRNSIQTLGKKFTFKENLEYQNNKTEWNVNEDIKVNLIFNQKEIVNRLYKEKIRLSFNYKTVNGQIQTITSDEVVLEDDLNNIENEQKIQFTILANKLKPNRLYTFAKVEKYNSLTSTWEKLDDDKEVTPTVVAGNFKVQKSSAEAFKVKSGNFVKDKTDINKAFVTLEIDDVDNVLTIDDDLNLAVKYIIEGEEIEKFGSNPHLVIDDNNLKQINFTINDFKINQAYKVRNVKYVSSIDKDKTTLTIGAYPEKDELIFAIPNDEIKIENSNVEITEITNLYANENKREISGSYNLSSNFITLFNNDEIKNVHIIAHFKNLKNQNIYTDVIAIDENNNFNFSLDETKNIQFNHKYILQNIYVGTKEQLENAITNSNFDSLVKLNINNLTKEVTTKSHLTNISIENSSINTSEDNKASFVLLLNSEDGYFDLSQQVKVTIKKSSNQNDKKEIVLNLSNISADKKSARIDVEFNDLDEETEYEIDKIIFSSLIPGLENQPTLVHANYQNIGLDENYFFKFKTKQNQFNLTNITFVNSEKKDQYSYAYTHLQNILINLDYEKSVERFNGKKVKLIFEYKDLDNFNKVIKKEIEVLSSNVISNSNQTLNFEIQNILINKNREYKFKQVKYEVSNNNWIEFDENSNLKILENKKFAVFPSQSEWVLTPEFVKTESNLKKLVVKVLVNDVDNVLGPQNETIFSYKDITSSENLLNIQNLIVTKENNQKVFKFEIPNPILDHEYKIGKFEMHYVSDVAISNYLSNGDLPHNLTANIAINKEFDKQLVLVETNELSAHASEPIISATYNISSNSAFLYTSDESTKAHFVVHFTNEQNEDIYTDIIAIDENNNLNISLNHSKNITLSNTYTLKNIYLGTKELLNNAYANKNFDNVLDLNINKLKKQASTKLFNLDEIFKTITPQFKQNFELTNDQKINLGLTNNLNKFPEIWKNKKILLEYKSKNFDEKIYFAKDLNSNDFIAQNNNDIKINDLELVNGVIKKARLYQLENIYFVDHNFLVNEVNLNQEIAINNNANKFMKINFATIINGASFTTEKSQKNLDATMQILDSPSLNQVKLKFNIIDQDSILFSDSYEVELNTTLKTLTANDKNKKFIGTTKIENNQKVVEFVVDDVFLNKENIADNLIIKNVITTDGSENKKININQIFSNKILLKTKPGGYSATLINTEQENKNLINSTYNLEIEISENLNNIKNNLRFIGQIIQSQVSDNRNIQALKINSDPSVQLNDNNVTIVFDNLVSNREYRNFDLFVDVNENVATNNKNSIIQSNSAFSVLVNEFATPAKLTSVELVEEINTLDKLKLKYKISSLDEILVDKDILNLTLTPTNNKRRYFFEQNKQLVKEGNEYFVTFEFDVVSGTDFRKYIKDDVNISATKIEENKVEEGLDYNLVLKFNSRPSRANENIKVANIPDNNFSFLINNLTKSPRNSIQTLGKKFTFKENLEYQNNKTEWNANEDVKVDLIIDQKEIPNRLYKEKIRLVFSYKTVDGQIQTVTTDEIVLEDGTNDALNQRRINFTIKANELKANRLYTFAKVEKYNSSTQIWEKFDDDKENNPTIVKGDFKVKKSIEKAFKIKNATFIKDQSNINKATVSLEIEDVDNVLTSADDLNLSVNYIVNDSTIEQIGSTPKLIINENNKRINFTINDFKLNQVYKIKTLKYVSPVDSNKTTLTVGAYPEKDDLVFSIENNEINIDNASVLVTETTKLQVKENQKTITGTYNISSDFITLFNDDENKNLNFIFEFQNLENQNIYSDIIAIDANNNFTFTLDEVKNVKFNHKYTLQNIYAGTKEQLNNALTNNNFDSLVKLNIDHLTKEVTTKSNPTNISIENSVVDTSEENKAIFKLILQSQDHYFDENQTVKIIVKNKINQSDKHELILNLSEINSDKSTAKVQVEFNSLDEDTTYQIEKITFANPISNLATQPSLIYTNYQNISSAENHFFEFTTKENLFKLTSLKFVDAQDTEKINQEYNHLEKVFIKLEYEKLAKRFIGKKFKLIFDFNDLDENNQIVKKEIEVISSNLINQNNENLNFEINSNTLTKNREYTFKGLQYELTNNNWVNLDSNVDLNILKDQKFKVLPSQDVWELAPEFIKEQSDITKLTVKVLLNDLDNVLSSNSTATIKYKDVTSPNTLFEIKNIQILKENNYKTIKFEILNPVLNHEYKIAKYELNYGNDVAFSDKLVNNELASEEKDISINVKVNKQLIVNATKELIADNDQPLISGTYNLDSEIAKLYTEDENTKTHFVAHFKNSQNEDIYSDVISIDENNTLNISLDYTKNIILSNSYILKNIYLSNKKLLSDALKNFDFTGIQTLDITSLNKQVDTALFNLDEIIKTITPTYKQNFDVNNKQKINISLINDATKFPQTWKNKKIILQYKSQNFNEKIYFAKDLQENDFITQNNNDILIENIELVAGTVEKARLYKLDNIYFVDTSFEISETNLSQITSINNNNLKFKQNNFSNLIDQASFTTKQSPNPLSATMQILNSPSLEEVKLKFTIVDEDNILINQNYEVLLDTTLKTLTIAEKLKQKISSTKTENNHKVVEFLVDEIILNKENLANKLIIKNVMTTSGITNKEIVINQIFGNKLELKTKPGGYNIVLENTEQDNQNSVVGTYNLELGLSNNLEHLKNQLKFKGQITQSTPSNIRDNQKLRFNSSSNAQLTNNNIAIVFDGLVSNREYTSFDLFVDTKEDVATKNQNSIIQSNSAFNILVNKFTTPAKLTTIELVEEINNETKLKLKYKLSSLDEILETNDIVNLTLTPTNNKRRYFFEQNKQLVKEGNDYFVTFEFDVVAGLEFRNHINEDINIKSTKFETNQVEEGLDYNLVVRFNSKPSRAYTNINVENISNNLENILINNLTSKLKNKIKTQGQKFIFKENLEYQDNKIEWNANENVKVNLIFNQKEIPNRLYKEKIRLVFNYKTFDGQIQTITSDEVVLVDDQNSISNERKINFVIDSNKLKANRFYTFVQVQKFNNSNSIWEKLDDDKVNISTVIKGDFKVKKSTEQAFKIKSANFIKDQTDITKAFVNLEIEDVDNVLSTQDDLNLNIKYFIEGDKTEKIGSNPHLVIGNNNLKQITFTINDFKINQLYKVKSVKYVSSVDENKTTLTVGAYPEKDELLFAITNGGIPISNANVVISETNSLHAIQNQKQISGTYKLTTNFVNLYHNNDAKKLNLIVHFNDLNSQNIYSDIIAIDANNNFTFTLDEVKNVKFNHKYTLQNIYAGTKEQLNNALTNNNFDSLVKLNIDHLTKEVTTKSNPTNISIENSVVDTSEENKAIFKLILQSQDHYFDKNQTVKIIVKNKINQSDKHELILNLSEISSDKSTAKVQVEFNSLDEDTTYQIEKITFANPISNLATQPSLIYANYQNISSAENHFFEFTTKENLFKLTSLKFVDAQNIEKINQEYNHLEKVFIKLEYEKLAKRFIGKKLKLIFDFNDLDENNQVVKKEIEVISSNSINQNNETLNFEINNGILAKNREYTFKKVQYQQANNIWIDLDSNVELNALNNQKFKMLPSQTNWELTSEFLKDESDITKIVVKVLLNDLDNVLTSNSTIKIKYKDLNNPNAILTVENLKVTKENEKKLVKFEIINPHLNHKYQLTGYEIVYGPDVAFNNLLSNSNSTNVTENIDILVNKNIEQSIIQIKSLISKNDKNPYSFVYKIEDNRVNLQNPQNKAYFKAIIKNNTTNNIYISKKASITSSDTAEFIFENLASGTYTLEKVVVGTENQIDSSNTQESVNNLIDVYIPNTFSDEKTLEVVVPVVLTQSEQTEWTNVTDSFTPKTPGLIQEFDLSKKTENANILPVTFFDLSSESKDKQIKIIKFTLEQNPKQIFTEMAKKLDQFYQSGKLDLNINFELKDDFDGYIAENLVTFGLKGHEQKYQILLKNYILNDRFFGQDNIGTIDNSDSIFTSEQNKEWTNLKNSLKLKSLYDIQPINIIDLQNKKFDSTNEEKDKLRKFGLVVEALKATNSAIGNRLAKLGGLNKLDVRYESIYNIINGEIKFTNTVIINPKNNPSDIVSIRLETIVINKYRI